MPPFQQYTGAAFGVSQVEALLEDLAASGWKVFSDEKPQSYVVVIDDENRINLWFHDQNKEWVVQAYKRGGCEYVKMATSFSSFKSLLEEAAAKLGFVLTNGPTTVRLSDTTPVSNRVGIATMAHGSSVIAIFDPFFDDSAISTLITLNNLGLCLETNIRVLMTTKARNRLTDAMIDGFRVESGYVLDVRFCNSNKEHRRFILLSSNESIVIGCSLNSIDKNEAARIEASPDDLQFFDDQWSKSTCR